VTISSPACSSAREWTTALAGQQVVLDPTGYPACLTGTGYAESRPPAVESWRLGIKESGLLNQAVAASTELKTATYWKAAAATTNACQIAFWKRSSSQRWNTTPAE
jgi:hypothetical protein